MDAKMTSACDKEGEEDDVGFGDPVVEQDTYGHHCLLVLIVEMNSLAAAPVPIYRVSETCESSMEWR